MTVTLLPGTTPFPPAPAPQPQSTLLSGAVTAPSAAAPHDFSPAASFGAPAELDAPLTADGSDEPLGIGLLPSGGNAFGRALSDAFAHASAALERADGAERAFIGGRGGLQEMVLERAQADVALSLASTAASRVSQALGTILGMQV